MLLKLGALLACGVAGAGLSAQEVPARPPAQPILLPAPFPSPATYALGVGDEVSVQVLDLPEIPDRPSRIDPAGDLNLPVIGRVRAAGLTAAQLESEIKGRLGPILKRPSVAVTVATAREQPFTVVGAVTAAGIRQLRAGRTLLDALSDAGGLRADAGSFLTITRLRESGPIPLPEARFDPAANVYIAEVDLHSLLHARNPRENIPLLPHDVITVPSAPVVYVMGEVSHPGEYPVKESRAISVLDALALAGGTGQNARVSRVRVLRAEPGRPDRTEIVLNVTQMLSGKMPEFLLNPLDILYVPANRGKMISIRAIETLVGTGSSIAVFRGAR